MTTPTDYKALAEDALETLKERGSKDDYWFPSVTAWELARAVLVLEAERTAWRTLAEDNDRIAMEEITKRETLETEDQELRAVLEQALERK